MSAAAPPQRPRLSELGRGDVAAAVALYERVMSNQFLARCGTSFLHRYFETWIESPAGIALLARADDGSAAAMLLGALVPARHYRWMARRGGIALALRLVARAIKRPRWGAEFIATRGTRYLRAVLRMVLWTQRHRRSGAEVASGLGMGEITHLIVGPEWQGAGLGSALLREAQLRATAHGVMRLTVVTPVGWDSAKFYTRLGWTRRGEIVSRSNEHFVRFELALDSAVGTGAPSR